MTRGKIIYIDKNGEAYSTIEFNGDMYPRGKADEVLERFEEGYFENYQNYKRFVERFNKRNYGYEEDLIHSYQFDESRAINITGNRTDLTKEQTSEKTVHLLKEEFVSIIEKLRDSFDLVEKVDELFRNSRDNVECDFCNGAGLQISHEGVVVLLLKKLMKDTDDWIDYFIYELDYGRKYEVGMITDEDGQDIDIHTPDLLYDFISNNGIICRKEV